MKKLYTLKKQTIDLITLAAFVGGEKHLFDQDHILYVQRKVLKPLKRWGHALEIKIKINKTCIGESEITISSMFYDEHEYTDIDDIDTTRTEDVVEYFLDNNAIQDIECIIVE